MNRNRTLVLASVALAMAFLAVGCDRLWNDQPSNNKTNSSWYWVPGGPAFQDWMLSGSNIIGQATIARPEGGLLNASFQMFGSRKMNKSHVHVVVDGGVIPANPNNWMYKKTHSPRRAQWTAPITWNPAWTGANKLKVAMYSEFEGGGDCSKWTQHYTWTVTEPFKDVTLPEYNVNFVGQHPNGNYSYWKFRFTGVGGGYDVMDNVWYAGWCAEQEQYMNQGQTYLAALWSSLQSPLPIRLRLYSPAPNTGLGWDNVNYILNHKQGTFWDVQAAIWYHLSNGGDPSDPEAAAMVNDAEANGDGWKPGAGDLMAVILEPICERQLVFIEIDP